MHTKGHCHQKKTNWSRLNETMFRGESNLCNEMIRGMDCKTMEQQLQEMLGNLMGLLKVQKVNVCDVCLLIGPGMDNMRIMGITITTLYIYFFVISGVL